MKTPSLAFVGALVCVVVAGTLEFFRTPPGQVRPNFQVGQQGTVIWPGFRCRNMPGSYCVTTYFCSVWDTNEQVWVCGECTAPAGTFKACVQWLEDDQCSPALSTNPCGDFMEDFAVNLTGNCPTDCNPATIIGPCTDYYGIHNC